MDHSDDEADPAVRKASDALRKARDVLGIGRDSSPSAGTSSELVPWAATAEARRAPAAGARSQRVLGVLASVALGVAGLGLGAAAANLVLTRGWPAGILGGSMRDAEPNSRPTASERLEQRVTDALDALKLEVAELRAAVARDRDEVRTEAVTKRLDELTARLDKAKAETSSAIAQLAARIDPLRQETAARLQAVVERLDRLEQRSVAAKPPEPQAAALARNGPARSQSQAGPAEAAGKPQVLRGWVLREVYDGLALVEGADGPIEVAPGELLPGAGRVRSIERRGGGWIVVTSRGVINHAPARFNPE